MCVTALKLGLVSLLMESLQRFAEPVAGTLQVGGVHRNRLSAHFIKISISAAAGASTSPAAILRRATPGAFARVCTSREV